MVYNNSLKVPVVESPFTTAYTFVQLVVPYQITSEDTIPVFTDLYSCDESYPGTYRTKADWLRVVGVNVTQKNTVGVAWNGEIYPAKTKDYDQLMTWANERDSAVQEMVAYVQAPPERVFETERIFQTPSWVWVALVAQAATIFFLAFIISQTIK